MRERIVSDMQVECWEEHALGNALYSAFPNLGPPKTHGLESPSSFCVPLCLPPWTQAHHMGYRSRCRRAHLYPSLSLPLSLSLSVSLSLSASVWGGLRPCEKKFKIMKNSAADRIIQWLTRNRLSLSFICLFFSLGFWWSGSWICLLAWGGRGGRTAVAGGGEREREREEK